MEKEFRYPDPRAQINSETFDTEEERDTGEAAQEEEPVVIDDGKYAPTIQGDRVFRPKHYTQYAIEPFTFLMLNKVPFAEGNVIKYVMRWRQKNGIEDLQKAKRVLDMMIEMETNTHLYQPKKSCL